MPGKQYELIKKDGIPIENYIARTMDGGYLEFHACIRPRHAVVDVFHWHSLGHASGAGQHNNGHSSGATNAKMCSSL